MSATQTLNPPLSLMVKLASIVAHAQEMLSPKGHAYDKIALEALLQDAEVIAWLKNMGPMVPVKR